MKNFFSIVIAFQPDIEELKSLCKNLLKFSKVIVLDNSANEMLKKNIFFKKNIISLDFDKNLGIAKAQNICIKKALKLGAEYISIFDQDSKIGDDYIKNAREIICSEKKSPNIFAPTPIDSITLKPLPSTRLNFLGLPQNIYNKLGQNSIFADITIASGTTIKSEVFEKVGFFDENFFIDQVDTEWCLRSKSVGYKIEIFSKLKLIHSIGKERKKIGSFVIQIHDPERCYYQIRNSFHLLRKKHVPTLFACTEIISNLFSRLLIVLFVANKREYFECIFRGFKHGILNKYN